MAITYLSGQRVQGASNAGGTITPTTDGSDTILKFTESGTFTPSSSFNIEYLVVAGGGAGAGYYLAGAGGAGGLRTNRSGATSGGGGSAEATYGVTAQTYTITVGAGGVGNNTGQGTSGGDSSIEPASGTDIISLGGGYGGFANSVNASSGGSGGGGDGYGSLAGGAGTANQGYAGGQGTGSSYSYGSGGGGGAGAVGDTGKTTGSGDGGVGVANNILISSVTDTFYAGGGGGSINSTSVAGGAGGNGGGGAGAITNGGDATSGTANTGGGGGGVGNNTASHGTGGSGGSGIVIIRFPTSGNSYTATMGTTDEKTTVTDVPVGSEFEQTDDYKSYQLMPPTVALPTGLTASSYAINTTGGGASYMRVNQSTDLLLSTDDMTWSFWFYPTVIPSGEAGFFKPNGGTLSVWCYLREVAQKMAIGLKGSGGTVYAYGDTTPTVNKWNLATISWDYSAENISIYMNGREETVTQSGTSGALSGNFDDFIFFSNTTTGSEDLDGYVAEVAMWEDYWSDDTNHDALWNSYSQSTNVGGKSCNDLGTTLNNKLRYFFTGEYANTTGDVILNQAIGTDSESALKGTPTNLSRLDGGNSWVERGST